MEYSKKEVNISKLTALFRSFRIGNESYKCLIISRIVTGWKLRSSNPEKGKTFSVLHPHLDGPGAHAAPSAMVIVDHLFPSRTEVKN